MGWLVSDFCSVFTLFVGVNFLGLPYTVATSGVLLATIILVLVAILIFHGCQILLNCKNFIDENKLEAEEDDSVERYSVGKCGYAILARNAFGRHAEITTLATIFVIHFCFCVGYIIFIGKSLESLIEDFNSSQICAKELREFQIVTNTSAKIPCHFSEKHSPDFSLMVWFSAPIFLFLSLTESPLVKTVLGVTSFLSIVGSFLSLTSLIGTKALELTSTHGDIKFVDITGMLFTFGQASSTLEGIGTVTELEDEFSGEKRYIKHYLATTFIIAVPAYLFFGILGYIAFGNNVDQIIVHNLLPNSTFSLCINAAIVVMVLSNYPSMAYPSQKILERIIFHITTCGEFTSPKSEAATGEKSVLVTTYVYSSREYKCHQFANLVSRLLFVTTTVLVSATFRNSFVYITAFTGAMDNCLLALIFPGLLHLKLFRNQLSITQKIKDFSMIFVGGILAVVSIISVFIPRILSQPN